MENYFTPHVLIVMHDRSAVSGLVLPSTVLEVPFRFLLQGLWNELPIDLRSRFIIRIESIVLRWSFVAGGHIGWRRRLTSTDRNRGHRARPLHSGLLHSARFTIAGVTICSGSSGLLRCLVHVSLELSFLIFAAVIMTFDKIVDCDLSDERCRLLPLRLLAQFFGHIRTT